MGIKSLKHVENYPDFFTRMADVIARRYNLNMDKSLRDVYQLNADFLDTRSDADFAINHREEILSVLEDSQKFDQLVELFVRRAIEFTYASNQFVQINKIKEAELQRIYSGYLREIGQMLASSSTASEISAQLNRLVKEHFLNLQTNISRFFDPTTAADTQSNVILQKVVCAEYTPEIQLEILGVHPAALLQPVLDLGCGKSGKLVEYLRQNGIQVTGIDRFVDPSLNLIQADWLSYPMVPDTWGTVISHMAFTNHFLFHHLYRNGSIQPYARQYIAILKSLKERGSFYYAPGLPFIEAYLPQETYQVTKKQIVDHLYASKVLSMR
jgi:hypothetical protein